MPVVVISDDRSRPGDDVSVAADIVNVLPTAVLETLTSELLWICVDQMGSAVEESGSVESE